MIFFNLKCVLFVAAVAIFSSASAKSQARKSPRKPTNTVNQDKVFDKECGTSGLLNERWDDCSDKYPSWNNVDRANRNETQLNFGLVSVIKDSKGSHHAFFEDFKNPEHIWGPTAHQASNKKVINKVFPSGFNARDAIAFCWSLNKILPGGAKNPSFSQANRDSYLGSMESIKDLLWTLPTDYQFEKAGGHDRSNSSDPQVKEYGHQKRLMELPGFGPSKDDESEGINGFYWTSKSINSSGNGRVRRSVDGTSSSYEEIISGGGVKCLGTITEVDP